MPKQVDELKELRTRAVAYMGRDIERARSWTDQKNFYMAAKFQTQADMYQAFIEEIDTMIAAREEGRGEERKARGAR